MSTLDTSQVTHDLKIALHKSTHTHTMNSWSLGQLESTGGSWRYITNTFKYKVMIKYSKIMYSTSSYPDTSGVCKEFTANSIT